ncbi:AI-2E family transporter [Reichenbachiella agariperforans]|uniref:Predicted PurR-regulated permease PerM n=1 Tax=Reichenbachiella agariperforans TaxID=156994 RepID=A0A1M6N4Z9_REIAG|nr:AI-2E family transporter [Reichenbachiella agariperforans]MBU2915731.1 AI-2E family transporter [Reichenbachiella agariperforans]SHJ90805.1 Predicted PurR-regulated permease PerM [Reichenbachiella agariperforans]
MSQISDTSTQSITKFTYILLSLIAVIVILVYTEEYVVPFIIALIIWFIIHELRENLQWIPWVRKNVPIWLQSLIAFVIINLVIIGVGELVYINSTILYENIDLYEQNFQAVLLQLNEIFNIDIASKVNKYTHDFDVDEFAASMLNTTTALFGNGFLIVIYVIFLLIEESIFPLKLKAFYPDEEEQEKKQDLFYKMDQNIGRYLRLKTIVSFLTGALSYIVLLIFGVEAALFWALLIFVLNFIPTVGSLIATVFPAIFAVLQMAELAPFVYIMLSVGAVQIIIGNVVEPKLMGTSLNMSSLVVVLSLTIWGGIWGIMGMILSVPITVMMIIVFEEIPSLRFIAVALSEKGELSEAPKRVKK